MNLRDQLLKAGVVSKKQARKAKNAAKKEKKDREKKKRQGIEVKDEVKEDIERKQAEAKERDRQLNKDIEQERARRAALGQITDIISSHDLKERKGNIDYWFAEGKMIYRIEVTQEQQKSLAKGNMGIVKGGLLGDRFHLLSWEHCLKLKNLDETLIACLHPQDGGEKADEDAVSSRP